MLYRCNMCAKVFNRKKNNSNLFEQMMCKKCLQHVLKRNTTLGIGILHYKEDNDTILNTLKSIDAQIAFDFTNLEVVIVTDGGGITLDEKYINDNLKHFCPTYYYRKTNGYCGGTRNTIIEKLNTDYIMFIDGDDELYSNKVLKRIYAMIDKYKPDLYCSTILEELYNGKCLKYNDLNCLHMCHGKAYKKDFLIANNIVFDDTIRVSEDIGFQMWIYNLSNNIIFDYKLISYKWKFNKASLTRNTGTDIKYDSYIRCFEPALTELNKWFFDIPKKNNFANDTFVSMMYNILYYRLQMTPFQTQEMKEKYLIKYFDFVTYPNINFELLDSLDKKLNKYLSRDIEYFSSAYKKYKRAIKN